MSRTRATQRPPRCGLTVDPPGVAVRRRAAIYTARPRRPIHSDSGFIPRSAGELADDSTRGLGLMDGSLRRTTAMCASPHLVAGPTPPFRMSRRRTPNTNVPRLSSSASSVPRLRLQSRICTRLPSRSPAISP